MNTRPRRSVAAGLALATAPSLAACGGRTSGGEASGVSDGSVSLGKSLPLSGPLPANGQGQLAGLEAAIDAVNAYGGVEMGDGKTRTIDLKVYDDAYDPARIVQNYRKLVDQDDVFGVISTLGTASNLAVMDVANKEKVPHAFLGARTSIFSEDQEANPRSRRSVFAYSRRASSSPTTSRARASRTRSPSSATTTRRASSTLPV